MAKGAKPLHQPLFDPDVIRRFEQTATVLNVGASANVTIEPKLAPIPSR